MFLLLLSVSNARVTEQNTPGSDKRGDSLLHVPPNADLALFSVTVEGRTGVYTAT
jgi:hypothetical protein